MDIYSIQGTAYNLRKVDWQFDTDEPLGLFLVWEEPKMDDIYCIGVDPSEGLGQDRFAIEVNRIGNPKRPDEQVAEWCGNINGLDASPILHAICKLYTTTEEPILAIEQNRGDITQMEMRMKYGWSNLYQYKTYDRVKKAWSSRIGWYTSVETRPKLMQRGINHISKNLWHVNSPWLVEEISNFEYDAEKMKMKAAVSCNDDRVMAGFIALYCSRDWTEYDIPVSPTDTKGPGKEPVNYQMTDISVDEIENGYDGMLYY